MSFFESSIVQDEIRNINEMTEMISENVLIFPSLSNQEKIKRVKALQEMLDKVKLFYTRLSLSDDPDAKIVKDQMNIAAMFMNEENLNGAFDKIQYLIDSMNYELSRL